MQKIVIRKALSKKAFLLFVFIYFFLALVVAISFYKERSYGDAGWRLFYLINQHTFCPSHGRWILALVQLLPLLGLKLHCSLKTLLILFSIGTTCVYFILALFMLFYVKDRLSALIITCCYAFTMGHIYFASPDLEMYLMVGLVVSLGLILSVYHAFDFLLILCLPVILFLIVSSHPTGFIFLGFMLVWCFKPSDRFYWMTITFSVGAAIVRFSFIDLYEAHRIQTVMSQGGALKAYSVITLLDKSIEIIFNHKTTFALSIFSALVFFRRGYFLRLFWLVGLSVSYVFILSVCVVREQYDHYMIPFSVIVLFIFGNNIIRESNTLIKKYSYYALGLISLLNLVYIISSAELYTQKTALIERLSRANKSENGSQWISRDENLFQIDEKMNTRFYYAETMLISGLRGADSISCIVPESDIKSTVEQIKLFLSPDVFGRYFPEAINWSDQDTVCHYADVLFEEKFMPKDLRLYFYGHLNLSYFHLKSGGFKPLNRVQYSPTQNVALRLIGTLPQSIKAQTKCLISLEIINNGSIPIYSCSENRVKIYVDWTKDGSSTERQFLLETDVLDKYSQPLYIKTPILKGDYTLSITARQNDKAKSNEISKVIMVE